MKKNNILYILLTVFFISCNTDDDRNVVILGQPTTDLVGTLSLESSIAAPGFPVGYSFTLPQSFSSDVIVTVKAVVGGTSESISTITVPSGGTTGSGTISIPNTGSLAFGLNNTAKVSIKGLALSPAEGDTFALSSDVTEVLLYDRVQWPYGAAVVAGRMTALFDWENSAANDLDMLMFNADTFDLVESAASGSRYETDIFNDTHPDGNYFVAIDFWVASGDIPWKIFFVHPNQTDITDFEGIFVGANSGDFVFPLINFTKSTDIDGNVSYTFSEPTKNNFSKVQLEKIKSQIERRK